MTNKLEKLKKELDQAEDVAYMVASKIPVAIDTAAAAICIDANSYDARDAREAAYDTCYNALYARIDHLHALKAYITELNKKQNDK